MSEHRKQHPAIPLYVLLLRRLFIVLGRLWPAMAAWLAYRIWVWSPRYRVSRREQKWERLAKRETLMSHGQRVTCYRWGEQSKDYVLLLHGWSGRATQLGAYAEAITAAGWMAVGIDAPGHGRSAGRSSTIFQMADAVTQAIEHYGIPRAIVTHSFGGMVAALVMRRRRLQSTRLVTINCPVRYEYLLAGYQYYFYLNESLMRYFYKMVADKLGEDFFEVSAADKNLQQANVPLLVMHDRDDSIVVWQQSEQLLRAVPGSQGHFTCGLGHMRPLRDTECIQTVLRFIGCL